MQEGSMEYWCHHLLKTILFLNSEHQLFSFWIFLVHYTDTSPMHRFVQLLYSSLFNPGTQYLTQIRSQTAMWIVTITTQRDPSTATNPLHRVKLRQRHFQLHGPCGFVDVLELIWRLLHATPKCWLWRYAIPTRAGTTIQLRIYEWWSLLQNTKHFFLAHTNLQYICCVAVDDVNVQHPASVVYVCMCVCVISTIRVHAPVDLDRSKRLPCQPQAVELRRGVVQLVRTKAEHASRPVKDILLFSTE